MEWVGGHTYSSLFPQEWNDHKGMKMDGMYLCKGNEWNEMELRILIGCFKIKEWK